MNNDTSQPMKIETGIIIVDHGSRRTESNQMLHRAADRFAANSPYGIVEPAHMELAEPSMAEAFKRCVQRGARRIIIFPYFLSPGRHWTEDIPALARAAAREYPGLEWLVTAPFGLHPDMNSIISDRIERCVQNASARMNQDPDASACDVCENTSPCQFVSDNEI